MIKLTATSLVLTKEALDRLNSQETEQGPDWDSLGLMPPREEEEEEELTDEDFEEIYSPLYIDQNSIDMVMGAGSDEEGSTIYLKSGLSVSVKESDDEIIEKMYAREKI